MHYKFDQNWPSTFRADVLNVKVNAERMTPNAAAIDDDDGRSRIGKAHLSLWLMWAKNILYSDFVHTWFTDNSKPIIHTPGTFIVRCWNKVAVINRGCIFCTLNLFNPECITS